jgi:hypothetical protein
MSCSAAAPLVAASSRLTRASLTKGRLTIGLQVTNLPHSKNELRYDSLS